MNIDIDALIGKLYIQLYAAKQRIAELEAELEAKAQGEADPE